MSDNAHKTTSETKVPWGPIAAAAAVIGVIAILAFFGPKSNSNSASQQAIAVHTAIPNEMLDMLKTIVENTSDISAALYTEDGVPIVELVQELVDGQKVGNEMLAKLNGVFEKVVGDNDGNLWFCGNNGQCNATCYQRPSQEWSCRNATSVSYAPPAGYTVCCTVNPVVVNNPGNSQPSQPVVIVPNNPNPGNGGSTSQGGSGGSSSNTFGDVNGGSAQGGNAQGGNAQGGSANIEPIDNSSYAYNGPTEINIPVTVEGTTIQLTINEGDTIVNEGSTIVIIDGQSGQERRIERSNFCRRLNRLCREGNNNACALRDDVCLRANPTQQPGQTDTPPPVNATPTLPIAQPTQPGQPTDPPQCNRAIASGEVRYVDLRTARCDIKYVITDCFGNIVAWASDHPKLADLAGDRITVTVTGCRSSCSVDRSPVIIVDNVTETGSCHPDQPTSPPPGPQPSATPTLHIDPPRPSDTPPIVSTPSNTRTPQPSELCPDHWGYKGYGCEPTVPTKCGLFEDCPNDRAPSGTGWNYALEVYHPTGSAKLWFSYGHNREAWDTFSEHTLNSDLCLTRYNQQGAGRYCDLIRDDTLEEESMKQLNHLLGLSILFPNGITTACVAGPSGSWIVYAGSGTCP